MHLVTILNQNKKLHALILNYLIVLHNQNPNNKNQKKKITFLHIECKDHNNKVPLLDNNLEILIRVRVS